MESVAVIASYEGKTKKILGHQRIDTLCKAMKKKNLVLQEGNYNSTMSQFKSRLREDTRNSVSLIFNFLDVLRSVSSHNNFRVMISRLEKDLEKVISSSHSHTPIKTNSHTKSYTRPRPQSHAQATSCTDQFNPPEPSADTKFVPSFSLPTMKPVSYVDTSLPTAATGQSLPSPQQNCHRFTKLNGDITDPCTYTSTIPDVSDDTDDTAAAGLTMHRLSNDHHSSLPAQVSSSVMPVEESHDHSQNNGQHYSLQAKNYSLPTMVHQHQTISNKSDTIHEVSSQPELQRLTSNASGSLEYTSGHREQQKQQKQKNYTTSKSVDHLQEDTEASTSGQYKTRIKKKRHRNSNEISRSEIKEMITSHLNEMQTQQKKVSQAKHKSENNKKVADQQSTKQKLRKRHSLEIPIQTSNFKTRQIHNKSRKQSLIEENEDLRFQLRKMEDRETQLHIAESNLQLREIQHLQQVDQLKQDRSELRESIRVFNQRKNNICILLFCFLIGLLELAVILFLLAYFKLVQ